MAVTIAWLALAGAAPSALAQTAAKAPAPAAAAVPASLDAILKQVALYDGGIESAAVWQLRDYVYARKDDAAGRAECEAKLLAFLKSPASPVARTIASRHLRLIAGDTAVPALQAMLTDDKSADLALYALQGIPARAAERALVQGLGVTTGATKIAIVAALGERRSAEAVPAHRAAAAAAGAGRSGRDRPRPDRGRGCGVGPRFGVRRRDRRPADRPSRARCSKPRPGFELGEQSLPIYERLASDTTLPDAQRRAALIGRIHSSDPSQAVIAMLASQDPLAQEAAIACVSFAFFPDTIGRVCATLPGLSDVTKVQLIAALAGYPDAQVASAVTQRAAQPDARGSHGGVQDAGSGRRTGGRASARRGGGARKGAGADGGALRNRFAEGAGCGRGNRRAAWPEAVRRPRGRTAAGRRRPAGLLGEAGRDGGAVVALADDPRAGAQGPARHRHALRHPGGARRAGRRKRGVRPD